MVLKSAKTKDYTSAELLEDILEDEEEHIDWLETQLGLIRILDLRIILLSNYMRNLKLSFAV